MPITKSAKKAARQNLKHRKINRVKKNALAKEIIQIKQGKSKTPSLLFSLADRLSQAGVIHPKKAARIKRRLSSRLAH